MEDNGPHAHVQAVHRLVRSLAGAVDPSGVDLLRLVRMVANQYETITDERLRVSDISGPRWGLLLRLLAEEGGSGGAGLSPTHLSRCQNVSKNTISVLVRGLEEQGLVERTLDSDDHRVFRIRLTGAGRRLVQETAPGHIAFLGLLASDLTSEERGQLVALLEKLYLSLKRHAENPVPDTR